MQNILKSCHERNVTCSPRRTDRSSLNSHFRVYYVKDIWYSLQHLNPQSIHSLIHIKHYFPCYRYMKCVETAETDRKGLYSYIMKTTMLWICEQYAPYDPVWSDFEKGVQILLDKLIEGLQSGSLPHFFIPEINLLAQIGNDVRRKCINIIKNLQRNIFVAAPFDIDEKLEFVRWFHASIEQCRMILALRPEKGVHVNRFLSNILNSASQMDLDL